MFDLGSWDANVDKDQVVVEDLVSSSQSCLYKHNFNQKKIRNHECACSISYISNSISELSVQTTKTYMNPWLLKDINIRRIKINTNIRYVLSFLQCKDKIKTTSLPIE